MPDKLTSEEAVQIALRHNSQVLEAQQNVEAARARILQARGIPNLEIGIHWNEFPTSFAIGDADEKGVSLNQGIENPFRRSARIDVAEVDLAIAQLELERVRRLVGTEVHIAVLEVLYAGELIRYLDQQLELVGRIQSLLLERYRQSQSSYSDVVRSRLETARLQNEIAQAGEALRQRKVAANVLLGRDPSQEFMTADSLSIFPRSMPEDSVLQAVLDRSITLQMSLLRIRRQTAAVAAAKADYGPDFNIGISYARTAEQPPFNANQYTGTTTGSFGVELGISVPLWFWLAPKGRVEEAVAGRSIAEIASAHTERRIRAQISEAIRAVRVASEQLALYDMALSKDSERLLVSSLAAYQNGQLDLLNLLDIYRSHRTVRADHMQALRQMAIALARIEVSGELAETDQRPARSE